MVGLSRGTRGGFLTAIFFALLATFTLAHGLVAWGVGTLVLAVERRWPRLIGWLVAGAFAAALVSIGAYLSYMGFELLSLGGSVLLAPTDVLELYPVTTGKCVRAGSA